MQEQFQRTELLLGKNAIKRLQQMRVAVFGLGGVGGYAAEALVRSGVGAVELIDKDVISITNLNRQIIALHSTLNRPKTEVMRERLLDINPKLDIKVRQCFFLPENADEFNFTTYDYVVDAVDTVTAKIALVLKAKEAGVPIISSMGAGNKLDPSAFMVSDLYETSVCPLAKVMRRELKKRGIAALKVVYSREVPKRKEIESDLELDLDQKEKTFKKSIPASSAFVPPAAGLLIASEVIKDLCQIEETVQNKGKNHETL